MMQRTIRTCAVVCFWSYGILSFAQSFRTAVVLSPGLSRYGTDTQVWERRSGLAVSAAVREEFVLSRVLSIGMAIEFVNTNGAFDSRYEGGPGYIPEFRTGLRHVLSIRSVDIPLFVRIRTGRSISNSVYLLAGGGLSRVFGAIRKTDLVVASDLGGGQVVDASPVANGPVALLNTKGHPLGAMCLFGAGKSFPAGSGTFFCEVAYRSDLGYWRYDTAGDPANRVLGVRRQCWRIGLGMMF